MSQTEGDISIVGTRRCVNDRLGRKFHSQQQKAQTNRSTAVQNAKTVTQLPPIRATQTATRRPDPNHSLTHHLPATAELRNLPLLRLGPAFQRNQTALQFHLVLDEPDKNAFDSQ